ncbi:MAG: PAS domain-containing protein [Gammaproteobacteria bacterium]|nr:PAS domain-containing protein [Gammaproteobacteria bacterium]
MSPLIAEQTYIDPVPIQIAKNGDFQDWKPLHFFNLYRIILAGLFVSSYASEFGPNFFGRYDAGLFQAVAFSYLGFAVINSIMIRQRWPSFTIQVSIQGFADIIAITLLMHASGGVSSGLGMLLVVAIAGCSLLTEGRTALFFAAIASLGVLIETILTGLYDLFGATTYTQAGILGAAFFATAFLAHVLAQRIRANEALADYRGAHLQYLAQLNEQIVQHIQSGIIVIDVLGRLRLFNETAKRLLGINGSLDKAQTLSKIAPELAEQVTLWRTRSTGSQLFRPNAGEVDVLASFTELNRAGSVSILIMLEDATLTARRAQQLKLASLGRLTASIAHEVRNPLGAISHAGQLLAESPHLPEGDLRLSQIIVDHCRRVNTIVESVLQLSRQREVHTECFDFNPWLKRFAGELAEFCQLNAQQLRVRTNPSEVPICFDPNQLHQVLWNLCENGLRYSREKQLELTVAFTKKSGRPYLDVRDHGPGITEEIASQIFEPFFTTESRGTGLGLYIAREICESNQAALQLVANSNEGCCFRLRFPEPVK